MTPPSPLPAAATARRLISRLAALALSTLVILAGAEGLLRATTDDNVERDYAELFNGKTDWEGLVLGTSIAAHGIVPRLIARPGLRWYNFGVQGAAPAYHADWWRLYRATGRKPKRVLYAIEWFSFTGTLSHIAEHDAEYLPLGLYLRWLVAPERSTSFLALNRWALYKARKPLQRALVQGRRTDLILHMDRYDHGYVPATYVAFHETQRVDPGNVRPHVFAAFRALVASWVAEGVDVVLVQAPSYTPLSGHHPIGTAAIAEVAREFRLPFLDYDGERRTAFNDVKANFIDYSHLSETGAQAFSRRLAADLPPLRAAALRTGSR